jgi:exodeoxyribonuclease III
LIVKVISLNVNGLRAAAKKGMYAWLAEQNADVICLQEIRAQAQDITDALYSMSGYQAYFALANKKGYSGVGIYSRLPVKTVVSGLGLDWADEEGRYLAIDLGFVWLASLYLPSGTSGEHRQSYKYQFLDFYRDYLTKIKAQGQDWIICGDFNIAHKAIDLKNWRANQKNSGFLPQERAWLDHLFAELGFVDGFRVVNQQPEQYTWWSNRGRAWDNNVGWRIDYQVVTPHLASLISAASIYKCSRFSDHAPLIMDYDISNFS